MGKSVLSLLLVSAGVLLGSSPISAHHGIAHYDMKKTITLTGTITAFDWGNPHCLVHMDVMDDIGHFQHWTLEMSATSAMSRRGWDKHTLKRGDQVIVETHPAQNGNWLGVNSGPEFALKVVINGREVSTR